MTAKEILTKVQDLFFSRLESKTGWGKNEIKEMYRQCEIDVLRECVNKLNKQKKPSDI